MISGSNDNGPVNKIIHFVLDILPGSLRDHSITTQWIKADTMC